MSNGILEWPAESIQATLFTHQKHSASPSDLFRSAFGIEATSSQENTNAQFGRLGMASAQIGGQVLNLNLQPGRCDVALNSAHNPNNFSGAGKISDVIVGIEAVQKRARALLPLIGDTARLAFSMRLVVAASTREGANRALLGVMPYKVSLTDEEDFVLQANWQTSAGGYKVNRLVRWSSEGLVMSLEQMVPGLSSHIVNSEAIVAVVVMDFNTWPGHTKFTVEKGLDVLDILVAETLKARKNNLRLKS